MLATFPYVGRSVLDMLHNTLSKLLVSVASRYAQLSPSDVGIGIGGGRLVIEDVQLRADTLNGHHIPFQVHEGRAGRLRVNVPWSALSSAPVEVYLENVHLIAGPKQLPADAGNYERTSSVPPLDQGNGEWHQTMLGRLLVNVSIEMYGLKVEYRDDQCVGIISIASLRAFSAGSDWEMRFISLLSDLDPDEPNTTAVTMRKLVRLSGVHWVMIPREKGAPPAAEELSAEALMQSSRLSERHLDLASFESKSPILDGIGITVKVLLCTGAAFIDDQLTPGLHTEIDVDVEEPIVNFTARQMKWIDHILKQGLGLVQKTALASTKTLGASESRSTRNRRSRSNTSESHMLHANGWRKSQSDSNIKGNPNGMKAGEEDSFSEPGMEALQTRTSKSEPMVQKTVTDLGEDEMDEFYPEGGYEEPETDDGSTKVYDDYDEHEFLQVGKMNKRNAGSLGSFWQAIVGENSDETADDAAIALGLVVDDATDDELENVPQDTEDDGAEHQYARNAVNAAANAGGLTLQLRVKTPDLSAWDTVKQLRDDLDNEKQLRQRLQGVELILEQAEARVQASESESQALRDKNAELVKELKDLEQMTSQAGKNKDAMIRQIEAALVKSERELVAYRERDEIVPSFPMTGGEAETPSSEDTHGRSIPTESETSFSGRSEQTKPGQIAEMRGLNREVFNRNGTEESSEPRTPIATSPIAEVQSPYMPLSPKVSKHELEEVQFLPSTPNRSDLSKGYVNMIPEVVDKNTIIQEHHKRLDETTFPEGLTLI